MANPAKPAGAKTWKGERVASVTPLAPEYLDVEGAAAFTGVPVPTLNTLRSRNRDQGPEYVKVGRSVRYPVESLRHWMQKRLRNASTPSQEGGEG